MEVSQLLCKIDGDVLKSKSVSKGVYFKKPRLVAYYEKNYDTVKPAKKIFYFKKPKPEAYPINLNDGYHTYTERKFNLPITALNCSLKYVMLLKSNASAENVEKTRIITRRGTLVDLMEIYYQKKYWECKVRVTRYNGNLYMVREKDNTSGNSELKEQDVAIKLEPKHTHDSQFLKNVFSESLYYGPNANEPYDANKELIGVHQSSFGEFEIIYSGPIYGIEAEAEFKDFDDMEALNTCRYVMAKQMWDNLRNSPIKYLNYWLQAYLAHATDLYFAYKDSDGFVCEPIIHKSLSELPKEFSNHWKPGICTAFLYTFLQNVNKVMSDDKVNCLNTVYEFRVNRKSNIITYKIFKDKPEMLVVTPEYMEYCKES